MIRVVEAKRVVTWRFWVVRILPIGFFMALTLLFGNLVYLYLTVAFIQMLKVRAVLTPPAQKMDRTGVNAAARHFKFSPCGESGSIQYCVE